MGTEVDGIAAIFLLGYNISDDITAPTIWVRSRVDLHLTM